MTRKLAFCTSAAAIALLIGSPAFAADAPSDDSGDGATVETVIVTATKRDTNLQDTPVAITALGSSQIEKAQINTIADVTRFVPSFQATTQGDHGVITMTLRGVGNDSAKTEYADPEVALFVDGVYTPRAEGASALLFDLQSIEVLRGPQGTLWGRNSTVGAVNMQTVKPTLGDAYGTLNVGAGNYGRLGVRAAYNLPLSDSFAVRLAFVSEQHDGYVDFQTPKLGSVAQQQAAFLAGGGLLANFHAIDPNLFAQGGQKYSAQDQTAVRISFLWRPSDNLSWNLSYERFQDRGTPSANLMQTPRPGEKFWSTLADTKPYLKRDVDTIRSRVVWDFSDDISLTYVAGYSRFTGSSDFDQDGGVTVPTSIATGATYQEDRTNNSKYTNYSHEVTLASRGDHRVDWILGAYYAAEDNSIRFDIPIFNGTQQGTVAWQGSFIQPKETVKSKAVFGQATFNISDTLQLTGGLRYTSDRRENIGGTNNAWSYNAACPQVPLDPGTDPRDPAVNPSCFNTYQMNDGVFTGNKLTYLVRLNAKFTPDFLAYASVSTGYKSGGLQDGGTISGVPYNAETLTNYEIGTKLTLFDGRATWNSSLFYEDFKDFQFSSPVTFPGGNRGLATKNADGAKVKGFESELAAKLTPNDTLSIGLSMLKTKLGVLEAGSNDYGNLVANFGPGGLIRNGPACSVPGTACATFTGNTLPHAPSLALQVVYDHNFELGNGAELDARIASHYETSSWLSLFNDGPGDKQRSYHRTDLSFEYSPPDDKPWSLELYVKNLEDGRVRTNAGATATNIYTSQYLPPRTYGLNFKVSF
ncbi:iron complex outermembrane receptor protein [Caulobacter ginsengisoli]|uniref:Iron complex outermembrane receptor protein n=1 Tax=Caulobacter ginsengisoli TaxID=400775 RepID=A0ABU0IQN8_9CAUL|nr:TonB-dependent receptor [Caulobacter ginsengisoli]MDQ0464331.1 iron complex outermembrane receptor protein [Caulobacter ginsengisoli]